MPFYKIKTETALCPTNSSGVDKNGKIKLSRKEALGYNLDVTKIDAA
jgi:hypothetical protein